MSYHNTTNESGQLLIDYEAKARSLEEKVFCLFQSEKCPMTWSDVFDKMPTVNEVSLKRAITNLKTAGKLEKTSEKGISRYTRPSYKYKLTA